MAKSFKSVKKGFEKLPLRATYHYLIIDQIRMLENVDFLCFNDATL